MKIDGEITHSAHPKHTLILEFTETPFDCHGCKEAGIGLKYKCQQCDYELHRDCGTAPSTIKHPFFKKCQFELYYQPPGEKLRICDACGEDIGGFVYHAACGDLDLHPWCVNLPQVLVDDGERFFYLLEKISGPCHKCGGKDGGWGYRSQCKTKNLHVLCAKKLLVESWLASHFDVDKNKITELQTRIPSINGSSKYLAAATRDDSMEKYCKLAGRAARLVGSAILGDPTALLAEVVSGFLM